MVSQGEFRSLGPVTRGGAEIALVTFSPTSRLLPVLVAQPPARPYKAGIAHRCSLVSLRAEGLPSLVIEPPDSLMGLLAPKTPSEPKNNSPPAGAWKFFWGPPAPHYKARPVWIDPLYFGVFSKGGSNFLA